MKVHCDKVLTTDDFDVEYASWKGRTLTVMGDYIKVSQTGLPPRYYDTIYLFEKSVKAYIVKIFSGGFRFSVIVDLNASENASVNLSRPDGNIVLCELRRIAVVEGEETLVVPVVLHQNARILNSFNVALLVEDSRLKSVSQARVCDGEQLRAIVDVAFAADAAKEDVDSGRRFDSLRNLDRHSLVDANKSRVAENLQI